MHKKYHQHMLESYTSLNTVSNITIKSTMRDNSCDNKYAFFNDTSSGNIYMINENKSKVLYDRSMYLYDVVKIVCSIDCVFILNTCNNLYAYYFGNGACFESYVLIKTVNNLEHIASNIKNIFSNNLIAAVFIITKYGIIFDGYNKYLQCHIHPKFIKNIYLSLNNIFYIDASQNMYINNNPRPIHINIKLMTVCGYYYAFINNNNDIYICDMLQSTFKINHIQNNEIINAITITQYMFQPVLFFQTDDDIYCVNIITHTIIKMSTDNECIFNDSVWEFTHFKRGSHTKSSRKYF